MVAEQVIAHFVDSRVRAVQLRGELACFRQQQEEERSTCDQVIHLSSDSQWRHGIICCFLCTVRAQRAQ